MPVLRLDDVEVRYGGVKALRAVDLELPQGGVIAVLGANGAGKTTMLRAISRLVPVSAGTISYNGRFIHEASSSDAVRAGIAQVPEGRRVFADLTVADNLALGAYALEAARAAERDQTLEFVFGLFPRLAERRSQKAGSLSGGEQQMLAIGRALMSLPTLLMLDEPSLGLAPVVVEGIYEALSSLKTSGRSMLIVEQNVRFAERLADSAVLLANGAVVGLGSFDALRESGSLEAAYLGKRRR